MRENVYAALTACAVVVLAGFVAGWDPGKSTSSPVAAGPVATLPAGPHHTNMPAPPGPGPRVAPGATRPLPEGPPSPYVQVWGHLADSPPTPTPTTPRSAGR